MDPPTSRKRGRPKKTFDQLSLIRKRQKAKKMRSEFSTEELVFATEKSLKADGFLDASKLMSILAESPEIATDYLQCYKKQVLTKNYTADEAVALMTDIGSTSRKYMALHKGSKNKNSSLYPPYHHVAAAKKKCYPPKEATHISELGFSVDLQSILDLTAERLIQTLSLPLAKSKEKLRMISKWGFDGASGQSQYKQKFISSDMETGSDQDSNNDDSSIFLTSVVPIVLHIENQPENTYWKNLKTSSTTLCRPLRLAFKSESEEYTLQIKREVDEEISKLKPTIIKTESGSLEIYHDLICSMVDGKICNYLSDNRSSQTCFICRATPKQMNQLDSVYERPKSTEFYNYGLSTLHAWIRFLECVLNVSYNMSFKKWRVSGDTLKNKRKERKNQIQEEFRKKTGMLIGCVKQGTGTTNDGNTARRFFRNYELSAQITGFDVVLLKRFAVILQVISSRMTVDVESFKNYTRESARMFVNLYDWYYMPATVHKILVHGADVIQHIIVPIGQLSEEVQESRHKEVRQFRQYNTRKISRLKTNEDLLHSLLISSDPLISSYRKILPSKKLEHFEEAKKLLLESESIDFETEIE